jgi:hypothetical protein
MRAEEEALPTCFAMVLFLSTVSSLVKD